MAVSIPAAERGSEDSRPVTAIEPPRRWMPPDLSERYDQREMDYYRTWRDIKAGNNQAALWASWASLQPMFGMAVFSMFFGMLGRIPSDGLPYPQWSFAGLDPC